MDKQVRRKKSRKEGKKEGKSGVYKYKPSAEAGRKKWHAGPLL